MPRPAFDYGVVLPASGTPPPQGQEIDDAWEAYDWLAYLEPRAARLVWRRANGSPWWRLAQQARRSERTVQRRHERAIGIIRGKLTTS